MQPTDDSMYGLPLEWLHLLGPDGDDEGSDGDGDDGPWDDGDDGDDGDDDDNDDDDGSMSDDDVNLRVARIVGTDRWRPTDGEMADLCARFGIECRYREGRTFLRLPEGLSIHQHGEREECREIPIDMPPAGETWRALDPDVRERLVLLSDRWIELNVAYVDNVEEDSYTEEALHWLVTFHRPLEREFQRHAPPIKPYVTSWEAVNDIRTWVKEHGSLGTNIFAHHLIEVLAEAGVLPEEAASTSDPDLLCGAVSAAHLEATAEDWSLALLRTSQFLAIAEPALYSATSVEDLHASLHGCGLPDWEIESIVVIFNQTRLARLSTTEPGEA